VRKLKIIKRIFTSNVFTYVATVNSFIKFTNNTTLSMVTFTLITFVTNPTTDAVNMATFVTIVANINFRYSRWFLMSFYLLLGFCTV
jgi:hypothetical protein